MDGYGLNVLVSYINNNMIGLFFVVDNIWLTFRSEKNIWLIFSVKRYIWIKQEEMIATEKTIQQKCLIWSYSYGIRYCSLLNFGAYVYKISSFHDLLWEKD